MYTITEIRNSIVPVPQKINPGRGGSLKLDHFSKFKFSAPTFEKGVGKTAVEYMTAFLRERCGDDCIGAKGIAVTLELGEAPKYVKIPEQGYKLKINQKGITITGFGEKGLFYGVVSFRQLCKWELCGVELPALEIVDWPDFKFRAYKQECRYGSNIATKQDWLDLIDDLASKKYGQIGVALYGCWGIQYDADHVEYLYLPLKDYPEVNTPMRIKYYSPEENRWYDCQTLPPIYEKNFFGELVTYAKDRAIDIFPSVNSLGHNTLFPRLFPECSTKDAKGKPKNTVFCTSSEKTYEILFSIYDQIIDDYLIPNGLTTFNMLMDEVTQFCECKDCKDKDNAQQFIDHAIKCMLHLKEKGMKNILIADDMITRQSKLLGFIGKEFRQAIHDNDLDDVVVMDWWRYTDLDYRVYMHFKVMPNELKMRSLFCGMNGYFIWNVLTMPLRNVRLMAKANHDCKTGEGTYLYAMYDKSCDLIHDCFADYGWNYKGTGELTDVVSRYVSRHFAPMQEEVEHAFKLFDWITEQRKINISEEAPLTNIVSNYEILYVDAPYYTYCYRNKDGSTKAFPGQALKKFLLARLDYERAFYTMASMAKEAVAIFRKAGACAGCDHAMANRLAYEMEHIQTVSEDWIALFKIYDLTQKGDQKKIAPIAKERYDNRIALMQQLEAVKEPWVVGSASMRNLQMFAHLFADIAAYIESTDDPKLDLMDVDPIVSKTFKYMR